MTLRDVPNAYALDVSSVTVEPGALRKIPVSLALEHDVLSLSSDDSELTVAVPDCTDAEAIEKIRLSTGMYVRALNAPREQIRARLQQAYPEHGPILRAGAKGMPEAPAVTTLQQLHEEAIVAKASDIHIEAGDEGGRVRQRVDGILRQTRALDTQLYAQLTSRVKLLAGMDIADKRQPQDGRYTVEAFGRSFDARVSSVPALAGEKIVIRVFDQRANALRLEDLNLPADIFQKFQRSCSAPHGFIVAAGPTGSGKTTTLYGIMAQRDRVSENLCSVEDPIEVRIPGASQLQVNVKAGVTFASALRAFLRQDPNVIMIGEMRDRETACAAATAALSGQLVLTTIHSTDAPGAIERLVELGVERKTIAVALSVVVAQRLLRRLCQDCRQSVEAGGARAREYGVPDDLRVFEAVGCASCGGSGYIGRCAIFEVLFVDDSIREALAAGASGVTLRNVAQRQGFRPMILQGLHRVVTGETTFDELRRVLGIDPVH